MFNQNYMLAMFLFFLLFEKLSYGFGERVERYGNWNDNLAAMQLSRKYTATLHTHARASGSDDSVTTFGVYD